MAAGKLAEVGDVAVAAAAGVAATAHEEAGEGDTGLPVEEQPEDVVGELERDMVVFQPSAEMEAPRSRTW